jgi:hypothetical protein
MGLPGGVFLASWFRLLARDIRRGVGNASGADFEVAGAASKDTAARVMRPPELNRRSTKAAKRMRIKRFWSR